MEESDPTCAPRLSAEAKKREELAGYVNPAGATQDFAERSAFPSVVFQPLSILQLFFLLITVETISLLGALER